jgi:hypothetical protein
VKGARWDGAGAGAASAEAENKVDAMLVFLKPRRRGDDVILRGFQAMYTNKAVKSYLFGREVLG